ncbi:ABC transporter ATP-binding protein [Pseudooceanicola atlanticus]|uniref:ABC transporter ATP-binding protein n=1 Tax=Pseudooceanicola atlanticus TaxID=1461694 RepID=UPI00235374F0|nr:ABC transporter ATP-binding protein [Pseudooceanicola atlanticus]
MTYFVGRELVGGYGSVRILNGCTIGVDQGQLAVVVGPNGAGKSTAMKALLGLLPLNCGAVELDGTDVKHLSPQQRIASGIAFVPQTQNVFPGMTVLENLKMGGFLRRDGLDGTIQEIFELFPILQEKQRQPAGDLSGGQRQQLAVGRALMTRPKVLLLDEPTAGVSPNVAYQLLQQIEQLKRNGLAILMVEQNAKQALEIADVGYVLVLGENRFTGVGRELLANDEVRKSFLGG